jgi:hypothetical protein
MDIEIGVNVTSYNFVNKMSNIGGMVKKGPKLSPIVRILPSLTQIVVHLPQVGVAY